MRQNAISDDILITDTLEDGPIEVSGYDNGTQNIYRTNIDFILNGQKTVSINESFTIAADSEIRIYFNENNKGIEHFFDSEYDPNVESITFIDLSNLLSDNLSKTNSLFKGCISLKSINLTFQNKVSLTNMDSMFSGCSSLESIDFSYINTSSIISMDSFFSGCSLLKKINEDEWAFSFRDEEIDPYVYHIEQGIFGLEYHRFTKESYKEMSTERKGSEEDDYKK